MVIIAPARGSNKSPNETPAPVPVGHHRPYEGQQQFFLAAGGPLQHRVLIAPARGSNDQWGRLVVAPLPTGRLEPCRAPACL